MIHITLMQCDNCEHWRRWNGPRGWASVATSNHTSCIQVLCIMLLLYCVVLYTPSQLLIKLVMYSNMCVNRRSKQLYWELIIPDDKKLIVPCQLRWELVTTITGSGLCEVVLQHFVHSFKLQVDIEITLSQHHRIPQVVVWPHGVVWYVTIGKPLWTHL